MSDAALVERAAAGELAAWRELWAELEPWLARMVASPRFLGRLGQREDDRNNILLEVMARLHSDGFRRLRQFVDAHHANPALELRVWLRVVAKRVGVDYLRGHQNYVDHRRTAGAGVPGEWIEAGALPNSAVLAGERPPMTDRGTARELLRYAAVALPARSLVALELWTHSAGYVEIAERLALPSADDAERLVRAALERLRRHFRMEKP